MLELFELLAVPELVLATSGGEDYGLVIAIAMAIVAVICMRTGYDELRKKRVMENVPTAKVDGVTVGLNELKGKAVADEPVIAPFSGEECIYCKYSICEKPRVEHVLDESAETTVVESEVVVCDEFFLHDHSGKIRVRASRDDTSGKPLPEVEFLAERTLDEIIEPDDPDYHRYHRAVDASEGNRPRDFTEKIIRSGEDIYLLGPVRQRDDAVEPEVAVGDDEGDGEIDFIIANKSENELVESHTLWSLATFVMGLLAGLIVGFVVIVDQVGTPMEPTLMSIGLAWVILVAMAYFKLVYDGLVEVRHRKERAFSMLDVEYKRRSDLIPRLVDVVSAAAEHESELQETLAEARSTGNAGDLDEAEAGPAIQRQTKALNTVFARVEDYPELKSDKTFARLIDQLTECEDKIALARQ
ncbi:MAG: LemA family protein, partial [Persicimonas sp.]